ncbi:MAG: hypothetical protein KAJ55_10615 [Anaerolineales bacterium]|nr:hypothetical protein [Anaerolineales bacterium]
MSLLLNETIKINREGSSGTYVKGHRTSAPDTATTIKANVQPLGGSELLQLPESDRLKEPLRFYTAIELKENDQVERVLNGREYEIQRLGNWAVFRGLKHYKAIGLLIDAQ